MSLKEDIALLVKNPSSSIGVIKEARQRMKFYTHLHEIFFDQPYYWLWSEMRAHTTVIDIGAFIGDSAAYFAMNPNVEKIIAFEPNENAFRILETNRNRLPKEFKSKITVKNEAVMDKDGYVMSTAKDATGFNSVKVGGNTKATTLAKELGKIKSNVVIKCDTEGSEYLIFENCNLNKVYAIQLEFHNGSEKLINEFRKQNFEVKVVGTKLGYLYAKK